MPLPPVDGTEGQETPEFTDISADPEAKAIVEKSWPSRRWNYSWASTRGNAEDSQLPWSALKGSAADSSRS